MKKPTKAKANKITYSAFNASDYLGNENLIAGHLSLCAQDSNSDVLLKALGEVAKARGMAQVAKDAGLGRESFYKALAIGTKPRYKTIAAVLKALKVRIEVTAQ